MDNYKSDSLERDSNESRSCKSYSFSGPQQLRSPLNHICASLGLHSCKADADIEMEASEDGAEYTLLLTLISPQTGERIIHSFRGSQNSEGRSEISREVLRFLRSTLGVEKSDWGNLVGVRPMKLFHKQWDILQDEALLRDWFIHVKEISEDKYRLLEGIGHLQRAYIEEIQDGRGISLYGGIPFCTSRCSYCSFPFGLIQQYPRVDSFVKAFISDMKHMGKMVATYELTVESSYLGGGTPTSLSDEDFASVLENFVGISHGAREITVEAGRPDTISRDKLNAMVRLGVDRISLNPQTMQDRILKRIGRTHKVEEIYRLYDMIRHYRTMSVNMDFICGLPDQKFQDMKENMDFVCQSLPENVTIHTLALKKGSPLYDKKDEESLPPDALVEEMVAYVAERLERAGYRPYYLYRQQYMRASMENVGYSLPQKECYYNIQMMEERQPILSMGPGSTSKWMAYPDFRQVKQYFPKDVDYYIDDLPRLLKKREDLVRNFYEGD